MISTYVIRSSGGLSSPDEPALMVRDLTGALKSWIETGRRNADGRSEAVPDRVGFASQSHTSTAPLKRVAIFVDVQNIYYTTKQAHGAHFDYNAFWRRVTADRQVVKATAFAIDRGDEKQRQFQAILRGIGMEVKLKPFIARADGSSKGDWDVGITLDMMDCAAETDIVVLASGDGDFDLVAHRLRERHGIEVEVYGVPLLTAESLKRAATRFIPIDQTLLLR